MLTLSDIEIYLANTSLLCDAYALQISLNRYQLKHARQLMIFKIYQLECFFLMLKDKRERILF